MLDTSVKQERNVTGKKLFARKKSKVRKFLGKSFQVSRIYSKNNLFSIFNLQIISPLDNNYETSCIIELKASFDHKITWSKGALNFLSQFWEFLVLGKSCLFWSVWYVMLNIEKYTYLNNILFFAPFSLTFFLRSQAFTKQQQTQ